MATYVLKMTKVCWLKNKPIKLIESESTICIITILYMTVVVKIGSCCIRFFATVSGEAYCSQLIEVLSGFSFSGQTPSDSIVMGTKQPASYST